MTDDRLSWWEALPLGLAAVAQSVIVGQWYYRSIDLGAWYFNIAVALAAGLALDAIVVATVMGRRVGRESAWSFWAALSAFLSSALIAIDTYSDWLSAVRPLLHISYPLMVLLEAQHLATAKKPLAWRVPIIVQPEASSADSNTAQTPLETLPERSRSSEALEAGNDAADAMSAHGQALISEVLNRPLPTAQTEQAPASGALHVVEQDRYRCDYCQAPLKSKQAVGAMRTNGYCPQCKHDRKAAR